MCKRLIILLISCFYLLKCSHLKASWTPVHKLDRSVCLDGGYCGVNILIWEFISIYICDVYFFLKGFIYFAKIKPNHSGTLQSLAWLESIYSVCVIVSPLFHFLSNKSFFYLWHYISSVEEAHGHVFPWKWMLFWKLWKSVMFRQYISSTFFAFMTSVTLFRKLSVMGTFSRITLHHLVVWFKTHLRRMLPMWEPCFGKSVFF